MMRFSIFRSDSPYPEDRETLTRKNDLMKLMGRHPTRLIPDPSVMIAETRYSFEPFAPGEPAHCEVEAPDYFEFAASHRSGVCLYPSGPDAPAIQGLTAWAVMDCVRQRKNGLRLAEAPLDLNVLTAAIEAAGTVVGHVYALDEFRAFEADGFRVIPNGTKRVTGPAGAKIVDTGDGRRVAVPFNGSYRYLTAAEVVDRAVRRVCGFVEADVPVFV